MRRIEKYTSLEKAVKKLISSIRIKSKVEVIQVSKAYGRVLAEDIVSEKTIPPHNMAHFDGFAVNSQDTAVAKPSKPVTLKIRGVIKAGEYVEACLNRGETYRIFTGGYLPKGADAVVPQEAVEVRGEKIKIFSRFNPGENVDFKGRDVKEGMTLLKKGHKISAQDIGLLLRISKHKIKVYVKPRIGILSVGSELTDDPDQAKDYGKILNTHRFVIEKLVEAAGGIPEYLGLVPDDLREIEFRLRESLNIYDMVLTIGGASVGDSDLVGKALQRQNPEEMVQGLRVQPGRVGGFAVIGGKPVIMLPGHILSTISAYTFLAYPIIRMLQGLSPKPYSVVTEAKTSSPIRHGRFLGFKRMVWVKVVEIDGEPMIDARIDSSSLYSVAVNSDAYILIPEGVKEIQAGEKVKVYFILGVSHL